MACLWDIDKATVLQVLLKGFKITKLGNPKQDIADITVETVSVIWECYNRKVKTTLSHIRFDVCFTKSGK